VCFFISTYKLRLKDSRALQLIIYLVVGVSG
jgi:hypothetical protein